MIHCFAGCNHGEVLYALGLHWDSLFGEPDQLTVKEPLEVVLTNEQKNELYRQFMKGLPHLDGRRESGLLARGVVPHLVDELSWEPRIAWYNHSAAREAASKLPTKSAPYLPGFELDSAGEAAPLLPPKTEGLALAFVDENDFVRGIQVRTGKAGRKYEWMSGGKGGSSGAPYHVALTGRERLAQGFRVTEGWIKAESAAYHTHVPTVGIAGTYSWQSVVELADRIRPPWVYLAFDMDWEVNAAVRRCRRDLSMALAYRQIDVYHERWDPKYNGIDDYLASGSRDIERQQVVPRTE